MRALFSFLIGIVTAAVVLSLSVLVAQNDQAAFLTILDVPIHFPLGWLVAGSVGLGYVLAVLLLVPGQMASAWRERWLGRRMAALERQLAALSEQQATLQGAHHRLLTEHQQVLAHALSPRSVPTGVPGHSVAAAGANGATVAAPGIVASPLPPGMPGVPGTPAAEPFTAEPLPQIRLIMPRPAPSSSAEAVPVSPAPSTGNSTTGAPSSSD